MSDELGRYAALDFIDNQERLPIDREDRATLRKWALARIADVEQAKFDRNRAEVQATAIRLVLREILPQMDELSDLAARAEAAAAPDAGNAVSGVVDAAVAVIEAVRSCMWQGRPFDSLQALSAKLADLQGAVEKMGLPKRRKR